MDRAPVTTLSDIARQRASHRPRVLRVLLAGNLTAMASPGGGETQMRRTAEALRELNVDARAWRPWEDDLSEADILHLFGSCPEHLPLVGQARRLGLKVALSTIAWFDLQALWREDAPLSHRLWRGGKFLARAALPRIPSWRRKLYQAADLLLPNSQAEAEQLMRLFGAPAEKIHVVPNGADGRFADADPAPFASLAGGRGFALYAGRVEPRKNQLGFLRAMAGTGAPIVVLGDPAPGHEGYYRRCREIAGENVRFLPRLEHDDPLLASAYAACGCLALTSWFETPGLVALEAALSGAPLVLTDRGCAREYFGDRASYVSPSNPREIREAILAASRRPRSRDLADLARASFTWKAAAEATHQAYRRAL